MGTLSLSHIIETYNYNDIAMDAKDIAFDQYDAMLAATSGIMVGLIDVFFVDIPKEGKLTKIADKTVDKIVIKAAKLAGWEPKEGHETIASAIGFFEGKFQVNYDHKSTKEVDGVFPLWTKNHHFKSLAHSPDPIGLFFSILDQFTNTATFISDGELIRIDASDRKFRLEGSNFISKLFAGFANWLGHLLSDVAGSSGSRGNDGRGNGGRGTGIPVPFMNLLQFLNVGSFQTGKYRNDFATVMVKVFQEGYDFRHGLAMAVPVLLNELIVRTFCVLRRRFQYQLPWTDCLPTMKDKTLRWMLLISTGAMCVADGAHAWKYSADAVKLFLRMNYVAWMRFIYLVIKEIAIFIKPVIDAVWKHVSQWIDDTALSYGEKQIVAAFYERIHAHQGQLNCELEVFFTEVKENHDYKMGLIAQLDMSHTSSQRATASVELARSYGVNESEIVETDEDLFNALFRE